MLVRSNSRISGVGVDEGDRDRRHAARAQGPPGLRDLRRIDRQQDRAVGARALVHLDPEIAVHHRHEVAPEAPGAGPVTPAHLQHVAEAARGDQADAGTFPFQKRIGADRRAVHHRGEAADTAHRVQAVEEAGRLVAAPRRHLAGAERPRRWIEREEVGEGAADIHPDDRAHAAPPSRSAAVAAASTVPSALTTTA